MSIFRLLAKPLHAFVLGAAALITAGSTPLVHAALIVTNPGAGNFRSLDPGTAGFEFTLSENATNNIVTSLGYIDQGGDGLAMSHQVGLWSGTVLIAVATVQAGTSSPLVDGYRYADLTVPVVLTLGATYTLGAQTTGSDLFRDTGSSAQFSPEITGTVARWIQEGTGGFSRPTNFGNGSGYMAPNMVVIPEPSSLAFVLLGVAGVGLRRRRS